jgi:thiol peroxidase
MRVLRRAVFVVGKEGVISYSDYMPELGDEPDYDAVLEAVRAAL